MKKDKIVLQFYRAYYDTMMSLSKRNRLEFIEYVLKVSFFDATLEEKPFNNDKLNASFRIIYGHLLKQNKGFVSRVDGVSKDSPPPQVQVQVQEQGQEQGQEQNTLEEEERDFGDKKQWQFINECKTNYVGVRFTIDKIDYYFRDDGKLATWNTDRAVTAPKALMLYQRMNENQDAVLYHLEHNK